MSYWEGGYNANIKIENLSDSIIENWYLGYEFGNVISNIWNAQIHSQEAGKYVIKNAGWNQNIAVGGCVEFGFGSNESFLGFPKNYEISGTSKAIEQGEYSINYSVDNDWGSGFTGTVTINNLTDNVMENWKIRFCFDNEITSIWNAEIVSHEGNQYVIKNANYNQSIAANSNVSFGFIVSSGLAANEMYDMVVECFADGKSGDTDDTEGEGNTDDTTDTEGEGDADDTTDTENEENTGDEGNTEENEIIVKIAELPYEKMLDTYYNIIEEFAGLSGTLTNVQDVESLYYEVYDYVWPDTDNDGLTDGEEVNIYFTKPLVEDTDEDGLKDGEDIKLSFDPTLADTNGDGILDGKEELQQEVVIAISDDEKKEVTDVSVSLSCAGDIENVVTVENVYKADVYSSKVVGLVGVPVDIQSDVSFDEAVITFHYDDAMLGETKEEDLGMFWYDEANHKYVWLEDAVLDMTNNTVSYTTEHFSTYLLFDKKQWFETWRDAINYDDLTKVDENTNYDIFLCLDYSVSIDELKKEKEFAKSIVDQMKDGDRVKLAIYMPNDGFWYPSWLTDKSSAKYMIDNMDKQISSQFNLTIEASGCYSSENNRAIDLMTAMKDTSSNEKVGFIINAGKNEDAGRMLIVYGDDGAEKDLKTLGFPVHSVSVTDEVNDKLEALLEKYDGNSFTAKTSGDVQRQYGYNSQAKLVDTDGDGLFDIYEKNGIYLSDGEVIYTDPDDPDTDEDGISDFDELGGIMAEKIVGPDGVTYPCRVSNMISDPRVADSDGDGIIDGDDPEPTIHFGMYGDKIDFIVTDTVKVPYNSITEWAKQVSYLDYNKIWNERAAYKFESDEDVAWYLLGLYTRACILAEIGVAGNGYLTITDVFNGKKIAIDEGCYFLLYYLAGIGGYVEYDGTAGAVEDPEGKVVYERYVARLLEACEKGVKKGKKITFSTNDSGNGHFDIAYASSGLAGAFDGTLNYWLAVRGGQIGMTGQCTFDGEEYVMELYYCIQDYYDFYYPDPKEGANGLGLVTNDEMGYLKLFGPAENFETCGVYHVRICWKKGQKIGEAMQKALGYTKLGK